MMQAKNRLKLIMFSHSNKKLIIQRNYYRRTLISQLILRKYNYLNNNKKKQKMRCSAVTALETKLAKCLGVRKKID